MPTQVQPDLVEQGLLDVLKAEFGDGVTVDAITENSIDDQGAIIVTPPAVLVWFDGEVLRPTKDNTRTTYDAIQSYLILCGARVLTGTADERTTAKKLASEVRNVLAGLRLPIEDEDKTVLPPIAVLGTQRFQFDKNGTWFAVPIEVEAIAQFDPKD
jgi:phage gp37-like protein